MRGSGAFGVDIEGWVWAEAITVGVGLFTPRQAGIQAGSAKVGFMRIPQVCSFDHFCYFGTACEDNLITSYLGLDEVCGIANDIQKELSSQFDTVDREGKHGRTCRLLHRATWVSTLIVSAGGEEDEGSRQMRGHP